MADIFEQIAEAGNKAVRDAGTAGDGIRKWIGSPRQRALRESLVGGLAGAALGGASGHFAGRGAVDDDDYKPAVSPALLGAILGGTAGAALPAGARALTGDLKFPSERRPDSALPAIMNLPGRGLDWLAKRVVKNPFVAGYTALHGLGASNLAFSKAPKSVLADAKDFFRASSRSTAQAAAAAKKSKAAALKPLFNAANRKAAFMRTDPEAAKAIAKAVLARREAMEAAGLAKPGMRAGLRRAGRTLSGASGSAKTRALGAALGLALAGGFDRKLRGDQ